MIYKRHVDDARFDVIKGHEFKSLKERLIAVRYLGEIHRTELIQRFFSENNNQRTQPMFPRFGKTSSLWSTYSGFPSRSNEIYEESLRADVREEISSISDSSFLLQLKGVDDKKLEAPIKEAMDLACIQLSSSIERTVKKMACAVLRMQQDECKRLVRHDIETEERKVLDGKLADFIQAINQVFHGRRPS